MMSNFGVNWSTNYVKNEPKMFSRPYLGLNVAVMMFPLRFRGRIKFPRILDVLSSTVKISLA